MHGLPAGTKMICFRCCLEQLLMTMDHTPAGIREAHAHTEMTEDAVMFEVWNACIPIHNATIDPGCPSISRERCENLEEGGSSKFWVPGSLSCMYIYNL